MTTIEANLQTVHLRIRDACRFVSRDVRQVVLLAVSKTFGPAAIMDAVAAGQTAFGENYVQEGVEKITFFRERALDVGLIWHCIGPLQSNKTRLVAEYFDWVQSVDRLKIAQRLSEQRPPTLGPLQVCLQVNVDGGANKSGVAPAELPALAQAVRVLPGLRLRGLMCIPEPAEGLAAQCVAFEQARD